MKSTNFSGLTRQVRLAAEVAKSSRVTIDMFGGPESRAVYESFVARHPRLPVFQLKTFGAALRRVDVDPDDLFAGKTYTLHRRKVRKAIKLGYRVCEFDPDVRVDEILSINRSSSTRQGHPVGAHYTDEAQVAAYQHTHPGPYFGVEDSEGILRAYANTPIYGDFFLYSRILGEWERLNDGIMYLLVDASMRRMALTCGEQGYPRWAMYDMYIGGHDGLREFKHRVGFVPMRVRWRWKDAA